MGQSVDQLVDQFVKQDPRRLVRNIYMHIYVLSLSRSFLLHEGDVFFLNVMNFPKGWSQWRSHPGSKVTVSTRVAPGSLSGSHCVPY